MVQVFETIMTLGICVVLPVAVVSIIFKYARDKEQMHKEVIMAALEKNADIDIEGLMRKMQAQRKTIKEKLLAKLQNGVIWSGIGLALFLSALWSDWVGGMEADGLRLLYFGGIVSMGIGIATLIGYHVGRKMMAKEIEAEEKKLTENKL